MNKSRSLLVRHSATLVLAISCMLGTMIMPASAYAAGISPVGTAIGGLVVGGVAGYAIGSGALSGASPANTSAAADAQCIASCKQQQTLATQNNNPQLNCIPAGGVTIACVSPSSGGVASGHCEMTGCKATSVTGLGGGTSGIGSSALGALAQALGGLLGTLLSSPSSQPSTQTVGGTGIGGGCTTSFYAESTTPTPADPCAYYVAPTTPIATTPTVGSCDSLSSALGLCGASTTPIIQPNPLNPVTTSPIPTTGITSIPTIGSSTTAGTSPNGSLTSTANTTGTFGGVPIATTTPPGLTGSIESNGTGATFVTDDTEGNTETSSFFGGDSIGGFVGDLIASWCENRPWANSFIATIIPPSFFDGLCTANGFAVGPPPAPPTPTATPTAAVPQTEAVNNAPAQTTVLNQSTVQQQVPQVVQVIASSTPFIPPRVDIWAVPPSVPLGSRTTIFWNTENVTDCSETSPDGSFSQSSLSGGAATVPLTEATTFSISCLDLQGNPATDYITVNIAG